MTQPNTTHTVGLALEGGGYRGMYTAGVLDVWMEHGLTCDHMVGVSAGAAFGYNFKSRQIGRAIRYNKAYCADKRYASVTSWLRTGDMFNADFAYHEVPIERDPIDLETYRACPMRFTCVCTDIETGEAVYHDLPYGDERDIEWIRASSAIPVATRPVAIEGRKYLDGGVADSIPSAWLFAQGYDRNVVVLTQPAGFVKQPNSVMPMLRRVFRHYPAFVSALEHRHEVYNRNGMQFPKQGPLGNCGPEFAFRTGRSFPLSLYTESASQFGRPFWDALSALEAMRLWSNCSACVYACCQVSTSSLAAA